MVTWLSGVNPGKTRGPRTLAALGLIACGCPSVAQARQLLVLRFSAFFRSELMAPRMLLEL